MSSSDKKMSYSPEQIEAIRANFLVNQKTGKFAPHEFVKLFIQTAEQTGLDPFKRHIMASSRNVKVGDNSWKEVWGIVTTIDGFRSIAASSGDYEGQGGPYWCGKDGVWVDIWTKPLDELYAAKVEVYRKGCRAPISATARFESYRQTTRDGKLNDIWGKFGDHMTAKCAEALALRKAFPQELGGLYTTDEMAQASHSQPEPDPTAPEMPEWTQAEIDDARLQLNTVGDTLVEAGISEDKAREAIKKASGAINSGDCTFGTFMNRVNGMCDRMIVAHRKANADASAL